MKQIEILQKAKVKKQDIIEITNEILKNINYFKEYDINTLSKRESNLLHFMISFGITDCVDVLINEGIDIFQKNKSGMYPVSYAKKLKDIQTIFNHPHIKNNTETYKKLHKLLYSDVISPVYFFKPKDFREFLHQNIDMLSHLNDDNITFLFNIQQILTVQLHEQYEEFKKEHNISFSNEDIYLYIIDKVQNNSNVNYNISAWSPTEHLKLSEFSELKKEVLESLVDTVKTGKEPAKNYKVNLNNYNDFYLYMSCEYEQFQLLQEEYNKIKSSFKKGKIGYINNNEFMDDLLYAWKDYVSNEKIKKEELQDLCEQNGLYGINISPVFSLKFITQLIDIFKKETLKVFPMKDGKLFAKNTYLKIQSNVGQSSGYLRFAIDKHIINIDVSDYSQLREDVFPEDIESLKRSFVHEYTHLLQVVSENEFDLNFNKDKNWLKIQNVLLENTTEKTQLLEKLTNVMIEEFTRNFIDFSDKDKLKEYLNNINEIDDNKHLDSITNKIMLLMPEELRISEFKKYIKNNINFMHECLHGNHSNLQKLYLEKLNRDEKLKNYYNDPVEIHARLNEHLLKLKNVDLLRDFNFLSDEDNTIQKKAVLKDLKKFNALILHHFEKVKEQNSRKLKMK